MKVHALVIGGSLAGLLAARVLADHFARVTIADRDVFPAGPEPRRGVPQARHIHVLLTSGQRCLEGFFPGLEDDLARAGAPSMNWLGESRWFFSGYWLPQFRSPYNAHPCSRDLLEWAIRRRLAGFPQVRFLEEHEAVELLCGDPGRITGARLRRRGGANLETVDLEADLVLDASGRETRLPAWLEALGYPPPEEMIVNSFLGYATRLYQKPAGLTWKNLIVRGKPPEDTRMGGLLVIEGERVIVTLGGASRDYPPTEEEAFLEFARSLPTPDIAGLIESATPLGPITGYRKTENRWRRYDRMRRWPENLVALGDSVCAFNPIYGEGMTVAALEAACLTENLASPRFQNDLSGLADQVQKSLAKVIEQPWLMATGDDFRYPATEGGRRSTLTRFMHRYMDQVMDLSSSDPGAFLTFFEVAQLLKPIRALFSPRIAIQVAKRMVQRRKPFTTEHTACPGRTVQGDLREMKKRTTKKTKK